MTMSITKINDLGCGWRGVLYSDGTMRVFDASHSNPYHDCIDLPKDSVDRLARIFREIQRDTPYTSNGKEE